MILGELMQFLQGYTNFIARELHEADKNNPMSFEELSAHVYHSLVKTELSDEQQQIVDEQAEIEGTKKDRRLESTHQSEHFILKTSVTEYLLEDFLWDRSRLGKASGCVFINGSDSTQRSVF